MRWISWTAAALGAGLLLCLAGGIVLAEATVHVPRLHGAAPDIDPPRTFQIRAADGALLRGWMFTPAETNGGCVVVLHGSEGRGNTHWVLRGSSSTIGTGRFSPICAPTARAEAS
jgi:hypothetical protein